MFSPVGKVDLAVDRNELFPIFHSHFRVCVLCRSVDFKRHFLKTGVGLHPGDIFFRMSGKSAGLAVDPLFRNVNSSFEIAGTEELMMAGHLGMRIFNRDDGIVG